jgi:hypothetical protein
MLAAFLHGMAIAEASSVHVGMSHNRSTAHDAQCRRALPDEPTVPVLRGRSVAPLMT